MSKNLFANDPVNAELDPVFISGYTGPGTGSAEERLRARQQFKIRDAELALSLLVAELFELKIDKNVFPGTLPESAGEIFALEVTTDNAGNKRDYWEGTALLRGRSSDRIALQEKFSRLIQFLPLSDWLTVNSSIQENAVTFCRITPAGSTGKTPYPADGVSGSTKELKLDLRICITPPEALI